MSVISSGDALTPREIKKAVGERVRQLRESKQWSQEQLGFQCGLHRNYIGGIERGERNVGVVNVAKLAKAFGIRPKELLP